MGTVGYLLLVVIVLVVVIGAHGLRYTFTPSRGIGGCDMEKRFAQE